MKRKLRILAFCMLIHAVACTDKGLALTTTPDKPHTASISLGAELSSGKYGTHSTTRSLYMPLIATWSPSDRFDMGVEIPFLYQSDSSVTTGLFRNEQQATSVVSTLAKGGPGGARRAQAGTGGPGGDAAAGSSSTVAGLGDIIFRLGVIALFEGKIAPQIRPSVFVKLPTADTAKGLGTGKYDAGAGIELTKWIDDLHLIAEGFYTYQGKADGFGLKNYFSYTGGIGYQLTEQLQPMVVIKGATVPSDFSSELLELRGRLIWFMTDSTSLDLYGSHGLTESSPEYGGGIAVIYSF